MHPLIFDSTAARVDTVDATSSPGAGAPRESGTWSTVADPPPDRDDAGAPSRARSPADGRELTDDEPTRPETQRRDLPRIAPDGGRSSRARSNSSHVGNGVRYAIAASGRRRGSDAARAVARRAARHRRAVDRSGSPLHMASPVRRWSFRGPVVPLVSSCHPDVVVLGVDAPGIRLAADTAATPPTSSNPAAIDRRRDAATDRLGAPAHRWCSFPGRLWSIPRPAPCSQRSAMNLRIVHAKPWPLGSLTVVA